MSYGWKIHNVPVQISLDQTTPGADNSFGSQDIAKPGSSIGDGNIDNGNMPLRFIVKPINPATEYINAVSFNVQVGQTITQLNEINTNAGLPLSVAGGENGGYMPGNVNGNTGYRPSSVYWNYGFQMLYPGFDHGNVYVREWINGENVPVTNGFDSMNSNADNVLDSNGVAVQVPIVLPTWCDKIIMYNYNFETGESSEANNIGNVGIVLAWVKPEYDLGSITLGYGVTAANQFGIGYVDAVDFKLLSIPINGPAEPVGPSSEDEDSGDGVDNSFNLSVTIVNPGTTDGTTDSNINVIPAYNFNTNAQWSDINLNGNTSTWEGYDYTPVFNASQPYRASINFSPNTYWTEQSYALPEVYQTGYNRYPIMFVLVPNDGYFLSRHNLRVRMVDGTGENTTVPNQNGDSLSASTNFGPHGWCHLNYSNVIGPQVFGTFAAYTEWISQSWMPSVSILPESYMGSTQPFFHNNNVSGLNAFINTLNSNLVGSTSTSTGLQLRGATKYNNVEVFLDNNTEGTNFSSILSMIPISTAPEVIFQPNQDTLLVDKNQDKSQVTLIDSKSYSQGTPQWGTLWTMESWTPDLSEAAEFAGKDHGLEFVGGQVPAAYCPSDWAGNAVLVAINNIGSYIPGQAPSDIKIFIEGGAMPDDGSTCVDFNVNIDGGGDINSGSQG